MNATPTMPHVSGLDPGTDALIALGSNLGDKAANISRAIEALTATGEIRLVARSQNLRTEPWGNTDQDWFLNACIAIATKLTPRALLDRCQAIEKQLGRIRGVKWGPRSIDLDILVHGTHVIDQPGLTIPHPHMTERVFVLEPLCQIAPSLVVNGRTVRQWLKLLAKNKA